VRTCDCEWINPHFSFHPHIFHIKLGPRAEGDGWVIYEEAAVVKSSGQAPESAG